MKDRVDSWIGERLAAATDAVLKRPAHIVWGTLLVTAVLGVYAALNLGINSDNVQLLDDDVPYWQVRDEYVKLFPILSNSLLVVVDARTADLVREGTERLRVALARRTDHFREVHLPGSDPFFERAALLYRSPDELEEFADELARLQPLIAALEADPTLGRLARILERGLEEAETEGGEQARWSEILDQISVATVEVYEEYPVHLSWDEILLQGSELDQGTRRILTVEPILDFDSVLPAGPALAVVRETVRELELDDTHGFRVRVTGNPALNYEEMLGLAWDIGGAGVFCFLLVALVLYRALRSVPLVVAALATLIVGLIWTAAFAALTVGRLNLVSISFAVLFIGLGVDFAIHLGMHYARLRCRGQAHAPALHGAVQEVGASLVVCAISTAIGFAVFIPTDFRGIAELGLIASAGMPIILVLSLTFFPALLSSWLPVPGLEGLRSDLRFRAPWAAALFRHPWAVLGVALALGSAAAVISPWAEFDENVVEMRNPNTESVQVFNELLDERGVSSPWYANVVAPDLVAADALAIELRARPEVERVVTLSSFIPDEQEEKLEILEDLSMIFDTPRASREAPAASLAEQLEVLRR
ncbi:MAG: MMPL family transporter, partial [Myxococcota bacterium]